ncbi:PQQ-dependent catabolism-associated CXXCW motif protein [Rhodomicrobium lacus]|uniref:PQQ-dependent catabolism-associated CXXCW motif protein n=1 Tax=Rhodomicrobium TaxID=1068 RepID=UPI0026E19AF8|nr:PQQ-dependent catabolism-associated CXXCW motif protein [Rhodomicrobium lacus]WKW50271.1 PQQ-dependent catabolism-associated CXXCW motif protein [Rhodomicrobium lacus]
MTKPFLFLAVTLLAFANPTLADDAQPTIPEPPDYRTEAYRAPTPQTLHGAKVLDTAAAAALWRAETSVFVDVLPRTPRPANLAPGTLWREKPRRDIPGSIWLPNTGFGSLSPAMEAYFREGLETASGRDFSKTLVFYCLRECWMSWNAAKRALSLGYTSVNWYPEGTDGWEAAGLPVEERQPIPEPHS